MILILVVLTLCSANTYSATLANKEQPEISVLKDNMGGEELERHKKSNYGQEFVSQCQCSSEPVNRPQLYAAPIYSSSVYVTPPPGYRSADSKMINQPAVHRFTESGMDIALPKLTQRNAEFGINMVQPMQIITDLGTFMRSPPMMRSVEPGMNTYAGFPMNIQSQKAMSEMRSMEPLWKERSEVPSWSARAYAPAYISSYSVPAKLSYTAAYPKYQNVKIPFISTCSANSVSGDILPVHSASHIQYNPQVYRSKDTKEPSGKLEQTKLQPKSGEMYNQQGSSNIQGDLKKY